MKIFWSPLAVERLDDIYDYITADKNDAAKKMIACILRRIETLSKNPERGRVVPEVNRGDIREVFEGEYRIIYKIDSKKVYILTIRNFKQLLPDTDIK